MKILIACEFLGIVREAFKKFGHDVWSCDFLPTEIPGQHYRGNILDIFKDFSIIGGKPDIMIGHPPCTYLSNSGRRWLFEEVGRFEKMNDAAIFFNQLLSADISKICIENPIQHDYARKLIPKYTQIIQPWQFGHGETKATCLWLKNLPKLQPTNIVSGREHRIWRMPPSPNRGKERSRTYYGIADAMAEQWTNIKQIFF